MLKYPELVYCESVEQEQTHCRYIESANEKSTQIPHIVHQATSSLGVGRPPQIQIILSL